LGFDGHWIKKAQIHFLKALIIENSKEVLRISMLRNWISGRALMERWQINTLDLVDIVLYERLHVYEPDGRLAKYEHEDAIRANHPSPFPPLPKKNNPSIYELILNSEAYDFEIPLIVIPPDYIPLANRIEHCMFNLSEVKCIEKELNIIVHDLDKNVQAKENINQTNVSTASTDEINKRAVKESGSIGDQLLENSGVGLFEEKSEAKSTLTTSMAEENIFRNEGDFWKIIYHGERVRPLKDTKGFRYLAILLQNPEQSFHVLDLVRLVNGNDNPIKESYSRMSRERLSEEELNLSNFGDAGQVIDGKALSEYKKKIKELEEDIDEAENNNDYARLEMLKQEKEFLEQQILAATDLKGRIRKLDNGSDRARKAVSVSIRASIGKIHKQHPELGQHLKNSIKTGFSCSYLPDKPISWAI
jgi:hypothetical protein